MFYVQGFTLSTYSAKRFLSTSIITIEEVFIGIHTSMNYN